LGLNSKKGKKKNGIGSNCRSVVEKANREKKMKKPKEKGNPWGRSTKLRVIKKGKIGDGKTT